MEERIISIPLKKNKYLYIRASLFSVAVIPFPPPFRASVSFWGIWVCALLLLLSIVLSRKVDCDVG